MIHEGVTLQSINTIKFKKIEHNALNTTMDKSRFNVWTLFWIGSKCCYFINKKKAELYAYITGRKNGFAPNLHLANLSKFGTKIYILVSWEDNFKREPCFTNA